MISSAHNNSDEGFVLPYVLVAIAILAITASIAAQRLQNISHMISKIQDEAVAELAFKSAETEVLYVFLAGIPVRGGMNIALGREASDPNLWSAAGEARRVDTQYGPVIVTYRDVTGLVPINSPGSQLTGKLLTSLVVKPNVAKAMTATLGDYIDRDDSRQFRGAERADYRLRKLPPPSNSPVRSYGELSSVLHWPEAVETFDMHKFMDVTTLAPRASYMKFAFTDAHLMNALGLNSLSLRNSLANGGIEAGLMGDNFPSGRGRFTFKFRNSNGGYRQRAIEFSTQLSALDKPYERFWVYETTVLEDPNNVGFAQIEKLKNVFHAPSTIQR